MVSSGSVEIPTGGKEPIEIQLFDKFTGAPLTGSTTIEASVRRPNDDAYLDWSDNTLKALGSVTELWVTMEEVDPTNRAGLYRLNTADHVRGLDTSKFIGTQPNDVYEVTIRDSFHQASALPTGFEIKTGGLADKINELPDDVTGDVTESIWSAMLEDHHTIGSFGDVIRRIVALQKENYFIDQTTYNGAGLLVEGRVRLFTAKADVLAASDGGVGEGEFATYTLTTTPKLLSPERAGVVRSVRD